MGNSEKIEGTAQKSWFEGLKSEFQKVIWPDKKSVGKQTAAVVAVTVVVSLIIAILDTIIKYGVDFLVTL